MQTFSAAILGMDFIYSDGVVGPLSDLHKLHCCLFLFPLNAEGLPWILFYTNSREDKQQSKHATKVWIAFAKHLQIVAISCQFYPEIIHLILHM